MGIFSFLKGKNRDSASDKLTPIRVKRDAFKSYWKSKAEEWWKGNSNRIGNAYCDSCSGSLSPDKSYYSAGRMKCNNCIDKSFDPWNGDPNWFGKGELDFALTFYEQVNPNAISILKMSESTNSETRIDDLIVSLGNSDEKIREKSIKELVSRGKTAVHSLVATLKTNNFRRKRAALEALGQIKDPKSVKPIVKSLADKSKIRDAH